MVPREQQGRLFQVRCAIWFARIQGVPYPKTECGKSAGATVGTVTTLGIVGLPSPDPQIRACVTPDHGRPHDALWLVTRSRFK
jgi:hypothetical protein